MAIETPTFSSGEAVRFGWRTTLANWRPLVAIAAVGWLLSTGNQAYTSRHGPGPVLAIAVQIFQALVTMALIRVALKIHDGERIDWSRPGDLLKGFIPYLLTAVLYALIVAGGLVLLIVPGILWAVMFGYATFAVVDKKLDPIAALRESSRLTKGERVHLFGFALVLFGVNVLGALACGVGLLVTVPATILAAAYVYRRLQARAAMRLPAVSTSISPATPAPTPAPSH